MSYEASQKAHQALRWLISNPSCYRCDSQAIVAWAIDSIPDVPSFFDDSYDVYNAVAQTDEEKRMLAENIICVDYAYALKKALSCYSASSKLRTHKRRIAIMSTDSSTKGRMSITYYRELSENEYEERIDSWHNTCKWYQPFGKDADGTYKSGYFIGAPAVDRIVLAVLGKRRSQKDTSYDKLVKNLREQLVHCIFDGERIPSSMVIAASNRASNPLALENTGAKSNSDRWRYWEYVLGAACALIKRYYHDYKKEEFAVKLEPERCDRDYLYGRLLAVADKIESFARYKQGKTRENDRATNAVRYMTAFSQHPFRTWNMLFTQQINPYIQQLNGAGWYFNLIGDIKQLFESGAFESDASLDGRYLLGF
ncbi:MAG: type I-C CRISPR-associated protein Cas8c/Csd1, partial [Bacillota bacterium]